MSEINPGVWDGLSSAEAMELYPDEWDRFLSDPYAHRAPRAESYHDLSVRIEPVIFELERVQDDLLIIGHASVIRCLLAYLVGLPPSEVPAVEIARGDLVEVTPASYGVISRAFHFWSGEGRGDLDGRNLYENFAEAANSGLIPDMSLAAGESEYPRNQVISSTGGPSGVSFSDAAVNMEAAAAEEEERGREAKQELVRERMKQMMEGTGERPRSAPIDPPDAEKRADRREESSAERMERALKGETMQANA